MQIPTIAAVLAVLYGVWQWMRSRQRVFLLDFACYKPPEHLKVCLEDFMTGSRESGVRPPHPYLYRRFMHSLKLSVLSAEPISVI